MGPGKCDSQRPCTLCSRASVECVASQPLQWRPYGATSGSRRRRPLAGNREETSPAAAAGAFLHRNHGNMDCSSPSNQDAGSCSAGEQGDSLVEKPWTDSSSTIMLVEEAFHHHNAASPDTSETYSLGYGEKPLGMCADGDRHAPFSDGGVPSGISRAAALELGSLLPTRHVADILVETYFDKIHWFMLLFHQLQFRSSVSGLYSHLTDNPGAGSALSGRMVGFTSVFLAVCSLSLRHIGEFQRQQLVDLGIEPETLRERILTTLRLRLLDIIALGSLEAVQMCVLLGSYYLYHGEPGLAWPLCGNALRLAQALGLHRSRQSDAPGQRSGHSLYTQDVETKKRCWWAIHEIETFCSMIYGFPLSISDADCDVEPLDSNDSWSMDADAETLSPGQPTLLEYKCFMSKLSRIIKLTLNDIYRTPKCSSKNLECSTSGVRDLIARIASLDAQLREWHSSIPDMLRLQNLGETGNEPPKLNSPVLSFKEQLFQLQALSLKLAFENTRILIHRPLLSYKATRASQFPNKITQRTCQDPFSLSILACQDAALQISWAGHTAIFHTASTTYALSFLSLHLLTAGVTLSIMPSLEPLNRQAYEWKLGIRRLLEMLVALRSRTVLADQGLELLKKLFRLAMERETEAMLRIGPAAGEPSVTTMPETLTKDQLSHSSRSDTVVHFNEDQTITQALQNVEQVFNDPTNATLAQDCLGDLTSPSFISRDQGWLWGNMFDFDLES